MFFYWHVNFSLPQNEAIRGKTYKKCKKQFFEKQMRCAQHRSLVEIYNSLAGKNCFDVIYIETCFTILTQSQAHILLKLVLDLFYCTIPHLSLLWSSFFSTSVTNLGCLCLIQDNVSYSSILWRSIYVDLLIFFVDLLVKKKNALGPGLQKLLKDLNSPASLHELKNSCLNVVQLLLDKHTIHKEVELRPRKRQHLQQNN